MPVRDEATATVLRHVGANIRALRVRRGLTQAELAEAVGIELRYLQSIEYGSASPSIATLVRVSAVLGKPIATMFRARASRKRNPGRPKGKRRARKPPNA